MTVKNATEYAKLVENVLGWTPPHQPFEPWRKYMIEASKINRRIKTNPGLYTWENLELAVELCRRDRLPRTPIGVFAHVERALEQAREPEADLDQQIRTAIKYEIGRGDPAGWAVRFTRAHGIHRAELLDEWKEAIL